MRAANHHGRGTARHASRYGYDAPHVDKSRSKGNRFWTWCGGNVLGVGGCPGMEEAELSFYRKRFTDGVEARNERYRARRQSGRVRTVEQVYRNRVTQPEESLLYIGDKGSRGQVPPDVLWACFQEYLAWECECSRKHAEFYRPLSAALHVDERGQWHVHERGVYQYQDADGEWQVGQAAALEAAGFPLPDPDADRSADNNRKMVWDAARREKWLDIVEAHGFAIEREPEAERPHMGLEAWQAWQDSMAEAEAVAGRTAVALQEAQEAQEAAQADREAARASRASREAIADAIGTGMLRRRKRETEGRREREADLARREADVAAREAALGLVGKAMYERQLEAEWRRQAERSQERAMDGERMLGGMGVDHPDVPGRGPKGR